MALVIHDKDLSAYNNWDKSYERRAIFLLFLGFGLVGMDRFMIMPLFPVLAKELHLNYADIGLITGALGIAWGISSIFMGRMADKIGHKRVLVPSLILFSILAGFSGFASTLSALVLIRAAIGFAEGAYAPSSIIATLDASKPSRAGFNVGLQQAAFPLFGLGVAPILVTQLLNVVDWHFIFALVSIPGFIVAFFMYRILRNRPSESSPVTEGENTSTSNEESKNSIANQKLDDVGLPYKWYEIFKYRNVSLSVVSMFCWLTALTVLAAFLPNYLTDYLHLGLDEMGFILSGIGFGGALGTIVLPGLSDRIGRKPAVLLSALGGLIALIILTKVGSDNLSFLFFIVFMCVFFIYSLLSLTVGPISAESVPRSLRSTSSGMIIGTGEIFSGSVVSFSVGMIAQQFGIEYVLYVAIGATVLGLFVSIFLKETAPLKLSSTT